MLVRGVQLVLIHIDSFFPIFFQPACVFPALIISLALKGSREKEVDEKKIEKDAKVRHNNVQNRDFKNKVASRLHTNCTVVLHSYARVVFGLLSNPEFLPIYPPSSSFQRI